MSTGRATERAQRREIKITEIILGKDPGTWWTPTQWTNYVMSRGTWRRWHEPNRSQVGVVLRRLVAEGDMERRQNPDDARSGVFGVVP